MTTDHWRDDLRRARAALVEAELSPRPADRYLGAHLVARRVSALVLTLRTPRRPGRLRNAWTLLAEVAPEYGEWAAFFAATQSKQEAVQAGAVVIVHAREADDLVRDAAQFLALVEGRLERLQVRHDQQLDRSDDQLSGGVDHRHTYGRSLRHG
ncbi:MAG: SAV_6107 family HEPN domain-containing protein [Propionibacteriaceae bacterium]